MEGDFFKPLVSAWPRMVVNTKLCAQVDLFPGVGLDDIVGVSVIDGSEMIVCLLSVLLAGAAFTPIDLSQPIERQRRCLQDCNIKLAIGRACDLPVLRTCSENLVAVDALLLPGPAEDDPENTSGPCAHPPARRARTSDSRTASRLHLVSGPCSE